MIIPRTIFPSLCREISDPKPSILLGARQTGKTFLLRELVDAARVAGLDTRFFDLEVPQDLAAFNKPDEAVFRMLTERPGAVFLDEFHYIPNASKLFKAVYDSGKGVKIFASGSSALEMHRHLKESLAGRRLTTKIYPLTYEEFLAKPGARQQPAPLEDYAVFGGLPGLAHCNGYDEKIRLLQDILETYIQKDVKALLKEENMRAFNHLLYLLAENQGSVISEHGLSREVGLTAATVNRHLSILAATYVCYPVLSYARRLGTELKKSKKVYFYDTGVRNSILKDFGALRGRADKGALLETFVLLQMAAMLRPDTDIRFWRDRAGNEIDFVFLRNRTPVIIEVKSALSRPELPRAFDIFLKRYPETAAAIVVSEALETEDESRGKKVYYTTFEKFAGRLRACLAMD